MEISCEEMRGIRSSVLIVYTCWLFGEANIPIVIRIVPYDIPCPVFLVLKLKFNDINSSRWREWTANKNCAATPASSIHLSGSNRKINSRTQLRHHRNTLLSIGFKCTRTISLAMTIAGRNEKIHTYFWMFNRPAVSYNLCKWLCIEI